jgi:glycosyltransferase domain-containing protein
MDKTNALFGYESSSYLRTTIIIPSFSRHYQLSRYISYLAHYRCEVILVDGSNNPLLPATSFTNGLAKFTYLHMPGKENFILRIAKAIQLVQTDFFCLMDDSDILLLTSIPKIETWLDENPGFFASGQVYNLATSLGLWKLHGWGRWYSELCIEETSSLERIVRVIEEQRTANLFYTVVPSYMRDKIVDSLNSIYAKDSVLAQKSIEVLFAAILLTHFKFCKLNIPFWIRAQFEGRDSIGVYPPYELRDCIFVAAEIARLQPDKKDLEIAKMRNQLTLAMKSWTINDYQNTGTGVYGRLQEVLNIKRKVKRVIKSILKSMSPSLLNRISIGSRFLASVDLLSGEKLALELQLNEMPLNEQTNFYFALGFWTYFSRQETIRNNIAYISKEQS